MSILGNDVHVWPFCLSPPDRCAARLRALLSNDELDRASRFRSEPLRRAFATVHGCLRALLGRYLAIAPGDVQFEYGPRGKPAVAQPSMDLRFNLSHSGEIAVFALAAGCEIGVDVEKIRPVREMSSIAEQFFSHEEAAALDNLTAADRELAFFRVWTCKEAYIKAVGTEMGFQLDASRVSVQPRLEARLTHIPGEQAKARSWQLHAFHPAPRCLGALTYPGGRRKALFAPPHRRLRTTRHRHCRNIPKQFPGSLERFNYYCGP